MLLMPGVWSGKKVFLYMPLKVKETKTSILGESKREIFLSLQQWQSSGHTLLQPRWKVSLLATLLVVSSLELVSP